MNELAKRKKKKGFTLVELIAVMAILAILAAVLAPKVAGYIKNAKKTKALEQVRTVVTAIESHNVNAEPAATPAAQGQTVKDLDTYTDIKTKLGAYDTDQEYVDFSDIKAIKEGMKFEQMKDVVNEQKSIDLDSDGKITKVDGTTIN